MKRLFFVFLNVFYLSFCYCQSNDIDKANCFTIIVGKNASTDGSVFLAHNEDDPGELLVDLHKVPGGSSFREIKINDSTLINPSAQNSFIWIEVPTKDFADAFMNEYGVTICSNAAQSKEKDGKGLIGYYLRKTLAIEAKSARDAVKIAGKLIEEYGYSYSGRTYSIADPDEAWILEIVNGRLWIAERLPDNEMAIISNYYSIKEINLGDTANYLGSSDLIEYARQKGWYDQKASKNFNFRDTYGNPVNLNAVHNIARKWACLNNFSGPKYDFNSDFPFSFVPQKKVALEDVINILQNHYEGTEFEMSQSYNNGNPHKSNIMRICSEKNQYSFIAQLRNWMPSDIGNILWFSPRRPCINPYIPLYFGVNSFPATYEKESFEKAEADHFNNKLDLKQTFPNHASWVFYKYAEQIDNHYKTVKGSVDKKKANIQSELIGNQSLFERNTLKIYEKNREKGKNILTEYFSKYANLILNDAIQGIKK